MLTDAEAVAYQTMNVHTPLAKRRPQSDGTYEVVRTARCLCGWLGPIHGKHLAHEIIEALKEKGMVT